MLTTAVIGERLTNKWIVIVYEDITERRDVEQKLIHAAEEWRTTFDAMPYGVFLLDRDFRIIRANKYVSAMCAISLPDIKGKSYDEIIYASGLGKVLLHPVSMQVVSPLWIIMTKY